MLEKMSERMDRSAFFVVDLWECAEDHLLFFEGAFGIVEGVEKGGQSGESAGAELFEVVENASAQAC